MLNVQSELVSKENSGDLRHYRTDVMPSAVSQSVEVVYIDWSDGLRSEFDENWLRDSCQCASCVHPTTHERLLHYTEFDSPGVKKIIPEESFITIIWKDDHTSIYANGWLRSHCVKTIGIGNRASRYCSWDANSFSLAQFEINSLSSKSTLRDALDHLIKYGVIGIVGASDDDEQVVNFARSIGNISLTNFGEVFDIQMKQDPNSNADTDMEFLPHTDIAHHAAPPGFQFLHFIKNTVSGGVSTLTDGFRVFQYLQEHEPSVLEVLLKPVFIYRFQDDNCDHTYCGPIFELDINGNFKSIRFDPIGIDPLIGSVEEVRSQRSAIKTLMKLLVSSEYRYERKFDAGEIAVFENTRVLHGRTAFTPGSGERKLRGCYVDLGNVVSKLQVLGREHDDSDGYVYDDSGKVIMRTIT